MSLLANALDGQISEGKGKLGKVNLKRQKTGYLEWKGIEWIKLRGT